MMIKETFDYLTDINSLDFTITKLGNYLKAHNSLHEYLLSKGKCPVWIDFIIGVKDNELYKSEYDDYQSLEIVNFYYEDESLGLEEVKLMNIGSKDSIKIPKTAYNMGISLSEFFTKHEKQLPQFPFAEILEMKKRKQEKELRLQQLQYVNGEDDSDSEGDNCQEIKQCNQIAIKQKTLNFEKAGDFLSDLYNPKTKVIKGRNFDSSLMQVGAIIQKTGGSSHFEVINPKTDKVVGGYFRSNEYHNFYFKYLRDIFEGLGYKP
ncbi:MAG: hypothetical protein ACTSXG_04025 [Alphaproteobacteria bacterium]